MEVGRLFYTLDEYAKARGVGHNTVRDDLKAGRIPAVFEGNMWKIPRSWAVQSFTDECAYAAAERAGADE